MTLVSSRPKLTLRPSNLSEIEAARIGAFLRVGHHRFRCDCSIVQCAGPRRSASRVRIRGYAKRGRNPARCTQRPGRYLEGTGSLAVPRPGHRSRPAWAADGAPRPGFVDRVQDAPRVAYLPHIRAAHTMARQLRGAIRHDQRHIKSFPGSFVRRMARLDFADACGRNRPLVADPGRDVQHRGDPGAHDAAIDVELPQREEPAGKPLPRNRPGDLAQSGRKPLGPRLQPAAGTTRRHLAAAFDACRGSQGDGVIEPRLDGLSR